GPAGWQRRPAVRRVAADADTGAPHLTGCSARQAASCGCAFRSDEVIRHRGLRLVYRFVSAAQLRAPTAAAADKCQLRYRIHSGRQQLLTSKQFGSILAPSAQKDAAVECTADFSALREDTKLLVSIATAQFLREGQCHANSISVYDGFTAADRQRKDFQPVCDNLADWTLMAATRRLVVRLTAKNLEHLPLLRSWPSRLCGS
uniref:SAC domain-containing protein n=1 Tax=Macrostomum lignano TaxID=282301 RepID=A0A1I8FFX6_9PLAT